MALCLLLCSACGAEEIVLRPDAPVLPADFASIEPAPVEDRTEPNIQRFADPYAIENRYDVPSSMFSRRSGVDYGTLDSDVAYYSEIAGDNKKVNVLLPAGYDETKVYPVMYVVHGFGGSHSDHVGQNTYLRRLYGNMLHEGLTVPMILVGVEMYTDKASEKGGKSREQLRYIYDKVIDEIRSDLMPFIEANYPVSKEREYTAVGGISEGGAKSLCIGFKWLDEFGWIGSFAPDPNVIQTGAGYESFWTDPYFQELPKPDGRNTPYYIYLAVGTNDPWNINCTLYYGRVLDEMGLANQTDSAEGYAHDNAFWGQCYYNFLSKVFREPEPEQ